MAILKCKMCGGDLNVAEGQTVCECDYCGSKQTVPTLDNEKKLTLFTRANRLRSMCEFDKAYNVYESIVSEFPEEAEAYWGLVLCKYGIEYVDDPASGRKIPTCHRSSFDPVLEDGNFEMVMEYADSLARSVYRTEAKEIERLRSGILEVSAKEQPYDIFICYKETDENGGRTIDSVIAQDVYSALTEKGYRVFFSRITLEDKLGQEYEPYIFAALHSAKIMLAFGTSYDYYNAVWVKNEWSRFLALIAKGEKKTLIPCYKDVDAYDMPQEFRRLQAQDMGKVGAIQDLLRGIEKILPRQKTGAAKEAGTAQQSTVAPLVKRAFMFLEDGEWKRADEYCEKALDADPENGEAYLGKLLAELRVHRIEELQYQSKSFGDRTNYRKAIRFGDEKMVQQLSNAIASIESTIQEDAYQKAISLKNEGNYTGAITEFYRIIGYKDARSQVLDCERCINEARIERQQQEKLTNQRIMLIRALKCVSLVKKTDEKYQEALTLMKEDDYLSIRKAFWCFSKLSPYKDSEQLSQKCKNKADMLKYGFLPRLKETNRYASDVIAVGSYHAAGVQIDGTVVATGYNSQGQCNVSGWHNIVSIAVGSYHTVGLKSDGTVVAVGSVHLGKCSVSNWHSIVAIATGSDHTVGLKSDGTVVAVGDNSSGQCDVSEWNNIVSVCAGDNHTVGLKSDGTVVVAGGSVSAWQVQSEIGKWKDIVAITAGQHVTGGLRADGTVVVAGNTIDSEWNGSKNDDIIAITAVGGHILGLREDGTVKGGLSDLGKLNDSIAIAGALGNNGLVIGLKSDGRVVVRGRLDGDISNWKLFDNVEEFVRRREQMVQERIKKEAEEAERCRQEEEVRRRQEEEHRQQEAEWLRQEEEARRRQEEECRQQEEKRRKAETERKRAELLEQIERAKQRKQAAETELANLKGLFTGKRRKELQETIAYNDKSIRDLQEKLKQCRN